MAEGLHVLPVGELTGAGKVIGDVENGGSLTPGLYSNGVGRIEVDGNYTQTGAGVLSLTLSGADNSNPLAPQYDTLAVSGVADLAGQLHVHLAGAFTPQIGDSFGVLFASGGFDAFDTYSLPSLPADRQWFVNPGGATLFLNVIAAISADFNGSGAVDGGDLAAWQAGFGAGPGATPSQGDATGDGVVNGGDFLAWQRQYGGPSVAAAVPEPPAGFLALLAALAAPAAWRIRQFAGERGA